MRKRDGESEKEASERGGNESGCTQRGVDGLSRRRRCASRRTMRSVWAGVSNVCSHCLPSPWRVATGHCTRRTPCAHMRPTYTYPCYRHRPHRTHRHRGRRRSRAMHARSLAPTWFVARRDASHDAAQTKRVNRRLRKRPRDKPKPGRALTVPRGCLNSSFCHANRANEGGWAARSAREDRRCIKLTLRSVDSRFAVDDLVVITLARLHNCRCLQFIILFRTVIISEIVTIITLHISSENENILFMSR